VGFPSYWNVLVLYLYVLDATPAWTIGSLVALSILSFVPLHYLYPSRTRFLRPVTLSLGAVWGAAMIAMCLAPDAAWAPTVGWVSLLFPAYYLGASVVHDRRIRRSP
jgi:phosphatidylcholine synthase